MKTVDKNINLSQAKKYSKIMQIKLWKDLSQKNLE